MHTEVRSISVFSDVAWRNSCEDSLGVDGTFEGTLDGCNVGTTVGTVDGALVG